jgi:hypothetical protein
MSVSPVGPVVSGQAYRVVSVDAAVPSTLGQFVGEVGFSVMHPGAGSSDVRGEGSAQASSVRFHEKDGDNAGKDVRVWEVVQVDGHFTATAIAAF